MRPGNFGISRGAWTPGWITAARRTTSSHHRRVQRRFRRTFLAVPLPQGFPAPFFPCSDNEGVRIGAVTGSPAGRQDSSLQRDDTMACGVSRAHRRSLVLSAEKWEPNGAAGTEGS